MSTRRDHEHDEPQARPRRAVEAARREAANPSREARTETPAPGGRTPSAEGGRAQARRPSELTEPAKTRTRRSEDDPAVVAIIGRAYAAGLSLRAIARALNELRVPTARGGKWQAVSVQRVVERIVAESAN